MTKQPNGKRKMQVKSAIIEKLEQTFSPEALEVIDESDKHRGHSGWREGGETHFRVRIKAPAFDGKTRVQQHRLINEALAEEHSPEEAVNLRMARHLLSWNESFTIH